MLLPALNYAERDRIEGRLSPSEEANVVEATKELTADAGELIRRVNPTIPLAADSPLLGPREPLRVLGHATKGIADQLSLTMLSHLLDGLPIEIEITRSRMQAPELIALVRDRGVSVVCLADLPPSPTSKTRYLVKRLRAAFPEARILVGRWAPEALADENTHALRAAGANHVGLHLVDTRDELAELIELPRKPVPTTADATIESAVPADVSVDGARSGGGR